MALDEESRHRMFTRLEEVLGTREAVALMEHLPPVGWADVATKTDLSLVRGDLDALEARIALQFEKVDQRFEMVDQRFEVLEARLMQAIAELGSRLRVEHRQLLVALVAALGISLFR